MTSTGTASLLDRFERQRLALFARHGFEGGSRWVGDRKGRRTYVIGRGEDRCPTVLVHGGISEASEWLLLAGRLPGSVLIPDRPGCGLSYRVDYRGADYRGAAVDWMLDLVDGIGADQVDLVGNSMGGYFSIVFALAHPDRVRRLVLAGAPAGHDRHVPLFLRLWGNPVTRPLATRMLPSDPEVFRRRVCAPLLVAHAERLPLAFLETAVAAAALPGAGQATATMLQAVTTLRGWPFPLLGDEMASLPVPTLFAWGAADAFAPPSSGHRTAARMPDARIEVIPDAGHLPYLDQPQAVAGAVTAFLARAGTA